MRVIKYCMAGEAPKNGISPDVTMDYSEQNEEIAKREAYNGEYEIAEVPAPDYDVPDEQAEKELLAALTGDISAEETIKEIMEVLK